jgi:hypothetical protein
MKTLLLAVGLVCVAWPALAGDTISYVKVEAVGYLEKSGTEVCLAPREGGEEPTTPRLKVDLVLCTDRERKLIGSDEPVMVRGRLKVRPRVAVGKGAEPEIVLVAESVTPLKKE